MPWSRLPALARELRRSGGRADYVLRGTASWGSDGVRVPFERKGIVAAYGMLGQVPYQAPSPEGWPDDAASWAGPDAVIKRVEWAQGLSDRLGSKIRPEDMTRAALGPALSARTVQSLARAESAAQGLTLALMSPEFQRR